MNSRTVIVCATVLSALTALPAQSSNGQAERVMQSVPVGYIVTDSARPRPPLLGSFLRLPHGDEEDNFSLLERNQRMESLSIDSLADLLRALSGDDFDADNASLDFTGSTLLLSGSAETVRRARRVTEEIGRIVTRPIRLEVALYRSNPDATYSGIAAAGELATLTRNLQLIWKGNSITRSGRQVALGRERYTSFIGDVDVEVAQKAKIGDPKVSKLFEGLRVVAEPHALSDGEDLVVFCQYAISDRRSQIQSRSTGVDGLPSLDAPHIATASGVMSARINSGGAMLLGLGGATEGGDSLLLSISVSFDAPYSIPQSGFDLISVSALTSTSIGMRALLNHDGVGSGFSPGDQAFPVNFSQDEMASMDFDVLTSLAHDLVEDSIDNGTTFIDTIGGYLVVRGQDSDRNRILAFLSQQETLRFQNQRIHIETIRHPVEASNSTFPARMMGTEAGETLHSLSFPALVDRPHFAMRGLESTGIQDFDVEIAQKSEQANPVISKIFSGIVCSVTPERAADGMAVNLSLRLIDAGQVQRRALEADWGGDLYLHSPTLTNFQYDGPLPDSGVLSLGDGPIIRTATQNWQTTQSITITGR